MAKRRSTTDSDQPKLSRTEARRQLGFLLSYYRPYTVTVVLCLLVMIPSSGISLVFPMLTGSIIDNVADGSTSDHLVRVGLTLLGLLVVQGVAGYLVSVTMAKVTEKVIAALRQDLFAHVLHLPLSTLMARRVGELSSRLSADLTQIQETFSFSFLQLLRQSVFFIGSVVIILATSIQLTVPILVGMPVIVGLALVMGRGIRRLGTQTQDALALTSTIVEESLQSVAAVKSYVREDYESSRYGAALAETMRLAIRGAKRRSLFVTFILFSFFGGIAAVILYGANLIASGDITLGELLAFLLYAMFVGGALGSVAEQYGQVQKTLGASVRIRELLDEPRETLGEPRGRYHSVRLDAVGFRYPERPDVQVLDNVTLDVPAGSRIALVGESGAGKSTIAALVQRLYLPSSGELRYDDQPAAGISLASIRSSVGVVPQDIVLFGGTIADNIRYGKLEASHDDIVGAARLANALDFITAFPNGFDTVVGERGMRLSGGQRQRIAIARALLKNPPILILDEATSSLDAESEQLIQGALENLMASRTSIVIAHRLSTVRRCDMIHVVAGGRIVESGTHEELVALPDGRYRRWCELQSVE